MNQPKENHPSTALNVSRRHFVTLTGAATAGLLFGSRTLPLRADEASATDSKILKGFIVSDAHFGWKDARQPAVEVQRQAMAHLMKRFTDLDIFIDTGDAHHSDANQVDRGNWADVVPGGCGPVPFYYLGGNHDLTAFGYKWDPEQDTMRMASIGCRPYFSFDVKNIHFLAIPELMNACSVTDEVLEWARLDLELNRDKTTIVLSHNALAGTTAPLKGDIIYRTVMNSKDVYKLLDTTPNVMAWMHGHNHDYCLVPKDGRLYVSNGRFGGFVPPDSNSDASNKLQAPLGGMYFEVHPDKFVVRSYSVPDGKFMDEMPGGETLSQTLSRSTGIDPKAALVYSFGVGAMVPGTKQPVYSYHAPNSGKLFLQKASFDTINQSPDLAQYAVRRWGPIPGRIFTGYTCNPELDKVTHKEIGYLWDNSKVTILPIQAARPVVFGIPGNAEGARGYYRVAPGSTVELVVDFGKVTPGVKVNPQLRIATNDTAPKGAAPGKPLILAADTTQLKQTFAVPNPPSAGVYTDPASDFVVSFWIDLEFSQLTGPVEMTSVRLTVLPDAKASSTPALKIGEASYAADKASPLTKGIYALDLPPNPVDKLIVESTSAKPVNWLVQIKPAWQSRNAPVALDGNVLKIEARTNSLTPNKDILLAPASPSAMPFVHRLTGICPAEVHLYDAKTNRLAVDVKNVDGGGLIEVYASTKPARVAGAEIASQTDNGFVAKVTQPGLAEFYF